MTLPGSDRRTTARLAAVTARSRSGPGQWLVFLAAAALAGGVWYELWPIAIAGAAALGWCYRPELNRAYLEGYADGLAAEFPEDRGGDRAELRGLPASAGEDVGPGADGAERSAVGAARGAGSEPDLRSALGLAPPVDGPARPLDDAAVAGRIGEGARRSSFPRVVEPATENASPIQTSVTVRGPAAGNGARAPRSRRQRAKRPS